MILCYLKINADGKRDASSIVCETLDGGKAKICKLAPCSTGLSAVYKLEDNISKSINNIDLSQLSLIWAHDSYKEALNG